MNGNQPDIFSMRQQVNTSKNITLIKVQLDIFRMSKLNIHKKKIKLLNYKL